MISRTISSLVAAGAVASDGAADSVELSAVELGAVEIGAAEVGADEAGALVFVLPHAARASNRTIANSMHTIFFISLFLLNVLCIVHSDFMILPQD